MPSMDNSKSYKVFKEEEEVAESTTLVSNGCVNYKGVLADKRKTGGWKASPFIIVSVMAESFAFYGITVNMVPYLVGEMNQSLTNAVTHFTNWFGACYVLTLIGAFIADAYLGRFLTLIVFSYMKGMGMVMLTLSGTLDILRPPKCSTNLRCRPASTSQNAFLACALALIALGTGGIGPCVSSFGADQYDESDKKECQKKYVFFNWYFFGIHIGALLGIVVSVYVQTKRGWAWGFGISTALTILSIFIVAAGFKKYRYQKPMGSPFTRFVQVIVASVRNHLRGVDVDRLGVSHLYEVRTKESDICGTIKLGHTQQYSFLDKAAIITDQEYNPKDRWKFCTVTQVEEFKAFIRILPIWASTIAISISFSQISSFFTAQAIRMDRKLGPSFTIPVGSIPIFTSVNALFTIPIYEKILVPLLRSKTGHPRGITSLQRIGTGLFISIFAMVLAAVIEKSRRDSESIYSVLWLCPQLFIIGMAEVFTYVGQLEFFYDEATDGTRSISGAMFLSEIGIGSWLSTGIVKIIQHASGGVETGWLKNDINESRLDYFYWILTVINGVNFLVFLWVSWDYKGKRIVPVVEEFSNKHQIVEGLE